MTIFYTDILTNKKYFFPRVKEMKKIYIYKSMFHIKDFFLHRFSMRKQLLFNISSHLQSTYLQKYWINYRIQKLFYFILLQATLVTKNLTWWLVFWAGGRSTTRSGCNTLQNSPTIAFLPFFDNSITTKCWIDLFQTAHSMGCFQVGGDEAFGARG